MKLHRALFLPAIAACASLGFHVDPLSAQDFELTRSTISGGATVRASGGPFELSGTIGEPNAGAASGGVFSLTGGFLIPLAPGDCDESGLVSLVDHRAFDSCFAGPAAEPPDSSCDCFDTDGDGAVDLRDFAVLQYEFDAP